MASKKNEPHETLQSALNQSLRFVFGESVTTVLCHHLEESYSLKLEDVVEAPKIFVKAIKDVFGEIGAEVVETLLVKDLITKFGIDNEEEINNLIDCFDKLKTAHLGCTKNL